MNVTGIPTSQTISVQVRALMVIATGFTNTHCHQFRWSSCAGTPMADNELWRIQVTQRDSLLF